MTQEPECFETAAIVESFTKNDVVYYKISATKQGKTVYVRKRFKHFEALHKRLLKSNYDEERLPCLPEKRFKAFVDHTDQDFIWERQFHLNNYIQDLLEYSSDPKHRAILQALKEFFEKDTIADTNTNDMLQRQGSLPSDVEDEEKDT
jgi:hypothetical protein